MEIKIRLNDMKYRYDVYHMFNIYFPLYEIIFIEDNNSEAYVVNILENTVEFIFGEIYFNDKYDENPKETLKKLIFTSLKSITNDIHPWGILTGIRPSKIALKYIKQDMDEKEIINIFKNNYLVEEEKARLCIDIAKKESKFINSDNRSISIYIGMPFCPTRCYYCSFAANAIGGNRALVTKYLNSLIYEIDEMKKYIDINNLKINTVYFGGGTPTSINDLEFENLLQKIYKSFVEGRNTKEFTVECGRPDSITINKLKSMKSYKVTRISINPQSMNDKTLKTIGRGHSARDVIEKFKLARDIGFNNINMDIIVGLPGEGIEDISRTRDEILKLKPESLTIHGLSLKRASILHENFILKKGIAVKSQNELAKMYEISKEIANTMNLEPYYMYRQKNMVGNMENLGYAKEGTECIYNIEMIEERQTIIALGADAVSKVIFMDENRLERFANIKDIKEYCNRIEELVDGKKHLLDTLYKKKEE